MAMLTPTPFMMRPTSFEHLALFRNFLRNFSGLRPTLGTVLRITADIGSIWIAFLFGWLIVDGNDLAALIARDSAGIVPLIGLLSILALAAYIAVGLYTCTRSYSLLAKICRIAAVNLALLVIAGAILSTGGATDRPWLRRAGHDHHGFDHSALPRTCRFGGAAHGGLARRRQRAA